MEIVPIRNYSKALAYELKIKAIAEQIGDQKAKDQLTNKNNKSKLNSLINQEKNLHEAQNKVVSRMNKNYSPQEFIIVFENVQSRNE